MATTTEGLPQPPDQPDTGRHEQLDTHPESPDSTVPLTDELMRHLASQQLSLAELRESPRLEAAVRLDEFARRSASALSPDTVQLPHRMTQRYIEEFEDQIAKAPMHRERLLRQWVPVARHYAAYFPQTYVTDQLYRELKQSEDPLRFRAADLLAVYGRVIQTLPRGSR